MILSKFDVLSNHSGRGSSLMNGSVGLGGSRVIFDFALVGLFRWIGFSELYHFLLVRTPRYDILILCSLTLNSLVDMVVETQY